jgi:hypothetical protein
MSQQQVRDKLGAPDRVARRRSPIFGKYTQWFYGLTRVDMFRGAGAHVFNVTTTSDSERTSSGIGVGSTRAEVAQEVKRVRCRKLSGNWDCWVGNFNPGARVTDFAFANGVVTRVTLGYVID